MNVTELGIVMDDNDGHLKKHLFPMEVTELGIVMDDNDVHL
jgi:hypothetical protein